MKRFRNCIVLTLFCIFLLCQSVSAADLIPGGQLIGMELRDNTVTIAAFDEELGSAAKAAGLKVGDKILSIDKTPVHCAEDVRKTLTCSDGQVDVSVLRDGKTKTVKLSPAITTDGPRLGLYLKQGLTGVGTVTWYDPDSGVFGALGHGVNSADGSLLHMEEGNAYAADILAVKKGKIGQAGQLMGSLKGIQALGKLNKNTPQGIFGNLDFPLTGEAIPTASAQQIKTGPAQIRSTVKGDQVQEYSVEILKIYPNSNCTGRNMLLKITDPALLDATGGIVQGMSGSPIIQDGKLIGAVTHVLVNDPTTGYGIFIENMLDAAA